MKILKKNVDKLSVDNSTKLNLNSNEFKKLVSKNFAPFLREKGWKGSGFIYRRFNTNNVIDVLEFSSAIFYKKFGISIGVHFDFIELPYLKDLSKLQIKHLDIRKDLAKNNEVHSYWGFPESNMKLEKKIEKLKELYDIKIEKFFKNFDTWQQDLTKIEPSHIEKEELNIPFLTKIRAALMMSRIQEYIENYDKAKDFAEYGLSKINGPHGSALRPEFERIIKAANKS